MPLVSSVTCTSLELRDRHEHATSESGRGRKPKPLDAVSPGVRPGSNCHLDYSLYRSYDEARGQASVLVPGKGWK